MKKIEDIKKRISELQADARLDRKELSRLNNKLLDEYNIDHKSAIKRLRDISKEKKKLKKHQKKILRKIEEGLDEIDANY